MSFDEPRLFHLQPPSDPHTEQQKSSSPAASEAYFTASERPSTESDDHSRITAFRFSANPAQHSSPAHGHGQITSGAPSFSEPASRGIPSTQPPARLPATVAFEENSTSRKANIGRPLAAVNRSSMMESRSLNTTPGMDTTPYVRFAIDQLTRDEEVRGSRLYPGRLSDVREREESEESYPVERIISGEALEYTSPAPPPPSAPLPHLPPQPSYALPVPSPTRQSQRISAPPSLATRDSSGVRNSAGPLRPSLLTRPSSEQWMKTSQTPTPDLSPVQQRDLFVPHQPHPDSVVHPPLNFIPSILRPLWLILFLAICLLMLAGLVFSAIWSKNHEGLWRYTEFGGPRYFIFQYLPILLGMFVLLWLFQIETALRRIAPFVALASNSTKARTHGMLLDLYPNHFLLPSVRCFSAGLYVFGFSSVASWLFVFTIPLLSACYSVRFNSEWRWVAVEGIVWATVGLYVLVIIAVLLLLGTVSRTTTGLKWDPRSLADVICLIERSNVLTDYGGSETAESRKIFRQRLSGRTDRLGYWHTTSRPGDVFYCIGEAGAPSRQYSVEKGRIKEKSTGTFQIAAEPIMNPSARETGDFTIRMDIRSSRVRLRYLPWYLTDGAVVAWVVIAVILLIAFFVISFLNNGVKDGWRPQVGALTNSGGFSASNFLYSFVPGCIGLILFLSWQSLDLTFRALQPFAALAAREGATAEQSLLVDYIARLPVSVTVIAASNGHYRVALLSFVSLLNVAIPVLAGGVFWTQYYAATSTIRVSAHMPGFYAVCFFLAVYTLAIFAILPGRSRLALPHSAQNLAEIISFLYQSPITTDRAFAKPATKAELVTRLMGAGWTDRSTFSRSLTNLVNPSRSHVRHDAITTEKTKPILGKEQPEQELKKGHGVADPGGVRYGFGVHVGRDGQEHLGIDRLRRGIGREIVIHEAQRRSWISRV